MSKCGSLENVDLFDDLTKGEQKHFIMAFQPPPKVENSPKSTKSSTKAKKKPAKKAKANKKKKAAAKKKAPKKKKKPKAKAKANAKKTIKKEKTSKVPSSWKEKVIDAIATLKERKGSSLVAIKKYLDAGKSKWRFINAVLKKGVADGTFKKNGGKYKVQK